MMVSPFTFTGVRQLGVAHYLRIVLQPVGDLLASPRGIAQYSRPTHLDALIGEDTG
jgi:hypothetical protein